MGNNTFEEIKKDLDPIFFNGDPTHRRDILDDNLRLKEFLIKYIKISHNYRRGANEGLLADAEYLAEYLNLINK